MAEQERDIEESVQEASGTEAEENAETIEKDAEEIIEECREETEEEPEEETGEDPNEKEDEAPEGEDPKSWAEKRAAKKQAKQDKKAEACKEQIAQLEDKVKRQLAEFENFRNRTEKEKTAMFETGAKSVIEKMLPVVDNFERGLATVPEDKKEDPFVDGMNRIYKQLLTELENIGVKPIEAVGKEFDPNTQEAVSQEASDKVPAGKVIRQWCYGYKIKDRLLKPASVVVSSGPAEAEKK